MTISIYPMVAELVILFGLVIVLATAIGSNDETFATVIGIKRLTINQAVVIGGVILIIGATTLGIRVAQTVGTDLTNLDRTGSDYITDITVILLSVSLVLLIGSSFGLPLSTTHTMVGSVVTLALIKEGISAVSIPTVTKIALSWVISPIVGFIGAYGFTYLINRYRKRTIKGLDSAQQHEGVFTTVLLVAVVVTAFSRGANDVSNAVAPILPLFQDEGLYSNLSVRLPLLLGGFFMAVGLIIVGRNVLRVLGNEVVELSPSDAMGVQLSAAIVTTTTATLGIPISGTHVLVAAFIGAGVVSQRRIQYRSVIKLAASAVGTPIVAGVVTYGMWFASQLLF